MIITVTSSGNNSEAHKTGPSLSASVLGFLGLTFLYPGGAEAFLGNTLKATRTAKIARISSITCIFALTTNLLEEFRTNQSNYQNEDHSPTLIHHKPTKVSDMWNPIIGGLVAGSVLQAKSRSLPRILKSGGFFGAGLAVYCLGLDLLEPYYNIKQLDFAQSFNDFLQSTTTGGSKKFQVYK